MIFETGLMRSMGSSWLPQLSHWSPRAPSAWQIRAGALDIAVRQGAPRRGRDRALGRLLEHVAVVVQAAEELLDDGVVVPRGRAGEEVVA